jgi:hypothetical protein
MVDLTGVTIIISDDNGGIDEVDRLSIAIDLMAGKNYDLDCC